MQNYGSMPGTIHCVIPRTKANDTQAKQIQASQQIYTKEVSTMKPKGKTRIQQ